jgi:hypothetical protein
VPGATEPLLWLVRKGGAAPRNAIATEHTSAAVIPPRTLPDGVMQTPSASIVPLSSPGKQGVFLRQFQWVAVCLTHSVSHLWR